MLDPSYFQPQPLSIVAAAFISAIIGASLNNCLINGREKRQSKIQYLESQIKELYAPLLSLVEESNNMFERANRLTGGKISKNRKDNFPNFSEEQTKIWDFFVEEYFIPIHRDIIQLITFKSHLIKDSESLSSYQDFLEYALDLESRHTLHERLYINTMRLAEAAEYPENLSKEIKNIIKCIRKELNSIR